MDSIEETMETKSAKLPPIFPGETLREDFLEPLGLSANRFAMELHVPVTRINDIAHCRRSISADTALRLARYFGTTPQFRINLQANYDLAQARAVITEVVIMRSCGPFGRTSFDLRANWRA